MIDRRSLPFFEAGSVDIPYVIWGWDEVVTEDTFWEAHSHPTHELLWNARGASSSTVGSRRWTITPSVGLWLPAGTVHTGFATAGTRYRTAHFGIHATPALADGPVAVAVTPLLRLLLDRLMDDRLASGSRALTEAMVLDLLEPSALAIHVQIPESELLRPIAEALEADPGDPRTLRDWSGALGVSERTVARAFRAETGLGFSRWQAAIRAQRAALLLGGELPIEEIAEAVGYGSVSAFGAAFRRTTGFTPGQMRME